jgi:CubicO group peptidase (beta-lactamase class C family)
MALKAFTTAALLGLIVGLSLPVAIASPDDAAVPTSPTGQTVPAGSKASATKSSEPLKVTLDNCTKAADYSAKASGMSMLVIENGKVIFEDYPNGHKASEPHELASGTKSFTGLCALAASEDGILTLDEKVSDTITEWKGDSKREILLFENYFRSYLASHRLQAWRHLIPRHFKQRLRQSRAKSFNMVQHHFKFLAS